MWTDLRLERPEAAVQLFCRARGNPPAEITWFLTADDEDDPDTLIQNDNTHAVRFRLSSELFCPATAQGQLHILSRQ